MKIARSLVVCKKVWCLIVMCLLSVDLYAPELVVPDAVGVEFGMVHLDRFMNLVDLPVSNFMTYQDLVNEITGLYGAGVSNIALVNGDLELDLNTVGVIDFDLLNGQTLFLF